MGYYAFLCPGSTPARYIAACVNICALMLFPCIIGLWTPWRRLWSVRCALVALLLGIAHHESAVLRDRTDISIHKRAVQSREFNSIVPSSLHNAGIYCKFAFPKDTVLAAYDSGAYSFWSELRVVNLDGVINNAAAKARFANGTLDYILASPIQYVLEMRGAMKPCHFNVPTGEYDRAMKLMPPIDGVIPGTEYFYGGCAIRPVRR